MEESIERMDRERRALEGMVLSRTEAVDDIKGKLSITEGKIETQLIRFTENLENKSRMMENKMSQIVDEFKQQMTGLRKFLENVLTGESQQAETCFNGGGLLPTPSNSASGNKLEDKMNDELPKIELPYFKGERPREWLVKAQKYFQIHNVRDDLRVGIAGVYLQGRADIWFRCFSVNFPNASWSIFTEEICKRFDEASEEGVTEAFCKIKQRNGIGEYQALFEELKSQVMVLLPSAPESFYISVFTSGLKEDIKPMVKMKRPTSLSQAFEVALLQETSLQALTRNSKNQNTVANPNSYKNSSPFQRNTHSYPQNTPSNQRTCRPSEENFLVKLQQNQEVVPFDFGSNENEEAVEMDDIVELCLSSIIGSAAPKLILMTDSVIALKKRNKIEIELQKLEHELLSRLGSGLSHKLKLQVALIEEIHVAESGEIWLMVSDPNHNWDPGVKMAHQLVDRDEIQPISVCSGPTPRGNPVHKIELFDLQNDTRCGLWREEMSKARKWYKDIARKFWLKLWCQRLTAYRSYVQEHIHPKLSDEAVGELTRGYVEIGRTGNLTGSSRKELITSATGFNQQSPRKIENLICISESLARIHFSKWGEKPDVVEVFWLLENALQQSAARRSIGTVDMDLITTRVFTGKRRERENSISITRNIIMEKMQLWEPSTSMLKLLEAEVRRCRVIFHVHQVLDDHKMEIARSYMEGKTYFWFYGFNYNHHNADWELFSTEICKRFSNIDEEVVDSLEKMEELVDNCKDVIQDLSCDFLPLAIGGCGMQLQNQSTIEDHLTDCAKLLVRIHYEAATASFFVELAVDSKRDLGKRKKDDKKSKKNKNSMAIDDRQLHKISRHTLTRSTLHYLLNPRTVRRTRQLGCLTRTLRTRFF